MFKLTLTLATTAALAASFAALPTPAAAQASDSISEVIVYGDDPCPRSTNNEVVVCARKPEGERFRIPEKLRSGGPRQARDSWANKARALETVGAPANAAHIPAQIAQAAEGLALLECNPVLIHSDGAVVVDAIAKEVVK